MLSPFEVGQAVTYRGTIFRVQHIDGSGAQASVHLRNHKGNLKEVPRNCLQEAMCAACGCMIGPSFIENSLKAYPVTKEPVCPTCMHVARKRGFKVFYNKHWSARSALAKLQEYPNNAKESDEGSLV